MKYIRTITLTITVLTGLATQGQDIEVEQTRSKLIVSDANLKIESLMARGLIGDTDGDGVIDLNESNNDTQPNIEKQVYDTEAYIIQNMARCSASENPDLCIAGLNFTGGFLFQQAAFSNEGSTKMFVKKASAYYEKVLETYPNNKAALSNLRKLNMAIGANSATIAMLEQLAEHYPKDRVAYLIQIGDLNKLDNKLNLACDNYQKAYREDPFSEKACGAIVELYTANAYECTPSSNIRQMALDCQEIDMPNYSEELLRKEMSLAFESKDYDKAIESMVLWAYVLADNGWLDPARVGRLHRQLFAASSIPVPKAAAIDLALTELQKLMKMETTQGLENINFWADRTPELYLSRDWERVGPLSVLLKLLHSKGEKAYFKKNNSEAEAFWNTVLDLSLHYDNAFFTVAATDLAQLYNMQPAMDLGNKKLDKLVIDLFNMKGAAYQESDLRMIRKYHMTLGAIFYDKKIWDGNGAANARFQLERAVSRRFGRIVNPELRKMLGEVHIQNGALNDAIGSYSMAVRDYLSLDLVEDADALHKFVMEKYGRRISREQSNTYKALGTVIKWRRELTDPNNDVQSNQKPIFEYLDKVAVAEQQTSTVLPKDFVQLQFFKGLTDLGSDLSDERKQEKQILFANALIRIDEAKELSTPTDFNRIKTIKASLEKSVERPGQLEITQMNKKANLNYRASTSKTGFKTYSIPTLEKEIVVPDQLFELSGVLQNHYRSTSQRRMVEIQYNNRQFKVKG